MPFRAILDREAVAPAEVDDGQAVRCPECSGVMYPRGLFSGIIVVSIVSIVMTVDASRYWSFGYLAGFVIGVFLALPMLSQTNFLGLTDWILYGGAALGSVALRIKIHSSSL